MASPVKIALAPARKHIACTGSSDDSLVPEEDYFSPVPFHLRFVDQQKGG